MKPGGWLRQAGSELGATGWAALGLFACAALFLVTVLRPLEARDQRLGSELARIARSAAAADPGGGPASAAAAKLEDFHRFLDTGHDPTWWLAKLYDIGKTLGLELGSADYRLHRAGARIERYEITLPLSGGYAQIRAFLKNALIEIPVLSLDRLSIRRERASDGHARAEVRFTLHLLKS
jgi:hypothetical protein